MFSMLLSRSGKWKKEEKKICLCESVHRTSLLIAEATVKSSLLEVLQRQRVLNVFIVSLI